VAYTSKETKSLAGTEPTKYSLFGGDGVTCRVSTTLTSTPWASVVPRLLALPEISSPDPSGVTSTPVSVMFPTGAGS
jgi:hypothetical protein